MGKFQETYVVRKQELRELLEKTAALRSTALLVLVKANRLTRHLTGRQRHLTGLTYHLGEIKARIHQQSRLVFQAASDEREFRESGEVCRNPRELRQKGLAILALIDGTKKKLLQLDILELRCRELLLSIGKALEAFHHESKIIHRKIYPFGMFSLFRRALRRFCGSAYFTLHDMESITALGTITGHVLRIADSPLM